MPRSFDVPLRFCSTLIGELKRRRDQVDPLKKDTAPALVDCGPVQFLLARHFGFCYGVENAIEIAYRAVAENPGKRVYLLSEIIHNQRVNDDLQKLGVAFLHKRNGEPQIPLSALQSGDVVIVPAFGTTLELQERLGALAVELRRYDATCPFVQKVWRRAQSLGRAGFTILLHGTREHEETRATFSHCRQFAPTLVLRDTADAEWLGAYLGGAPDEKRFRQYFAQAYSDNFDPERDLQRVGIVNQTTMLAEETLELGRIVRAAIAAKYGEAEAVRRFADTNDTLCYATHQNQSAVQSLLQEKAHLALVLGGYQSSNTAHLWALCAEKMPAFHIKDADEILSANQIRHFAAAAGEIKVTQSWQPQLSAPEVLRVAIAAGASCPDKTIEEVLERLVTLVPAARPWGPALQQTLDSYKPCADEF